MDENEKETIINKLIDELIAEKNKNAENVQNGVFVKIVLDNTRLAYDGDGLRITDDDVILAYIKSVYPAEYALRLAELKRAAKETEQKNAQTKEKGKKEA